MLRRIPKLLLLASLLAAFAASSTPTFGNSGKFCFSGSEATNCEFSSGGNCSTSLCKKGEQCSFSTCVCFNCKRS